MTEALYRSYVPGKANYGFEIAELQESDVAVAFIGGYDAEIALMARAAHDRGYPVQLMTATSLSSEQFGLIAGAGAEKCSSSMSRTRANAPKQRLWSSGSARQVSNLRV